MSNEKWDDPNWRELMKAYTTDERELYLLEHGPDSLASSWRLMSLHSKFKKIMGYKSPEPPNCQSSFNEFSKNVED